MKNKINVAELLKNCPKGMELDCTMFENVQFINVDEDDKPICIRTGDIYRYLTKFGTWTFDENAKCVIFPKGKTTWEGFHRPFKDGDVVTNLFHGVVQGTGIFDYEEQSEAWVHVCITYNNNFYTDGYLGHVYDLRLATEEEKAKLFQAIKDNGYKWNPETKTLETLVEFKDGDVITNDRFIAIFHKFKEGHMYYHCWYNNDSNNSKFKIDFGIGYIYEYRLASEKEKAKLFQVIKDNGYKWNPETKTLEKLPKFKVGDRIRHKDDKTVITITGIKDNYYLIQFYNVGKCDYQNEKVSFKDQDKYELVPNKFDINTLKPFDKVLVRNHEKNEWQPNFFNKYCKEINSFKLIGICTPSYANNQHFVNYCIPYEGNEHLSGKVDDCSEYFKTWK